MPFLLYADYLALVAKSLVKNKYSEKIYGLIFKVTLAQQRSSKFGLTSTFSASFFFNLIQIEIN